MNFKHKIIFVLFLFTGVSLSSQIKQGKITYERKTNLYKKFKGNDVKEWLGEEDKNKIDYFELYFNDTASAFKPQENELREKMSWATAKNTVYQNFNTKRKFTIKSLWGEPLPVKDTLVIRKWKLTESTRKIAGYNCRKAVCKINDTTRIYAWFSQELETSTGPESFNGLPGVILGLATEDGGVVYFANKVEMVKPDVTMIAPAKTKGKIYTEKELRDRLTKEYGKEKWGKNMIREFFDIW